MQRSAVRSNFAFTKVKKAKTWSACGALAICGGASAALASTGNFTGPLTNNVILSVDLNGGPIASANATTEGSNGPSASPVISPDPYGVTWSPWGGPTDTSGDGTQLPSSQSSPTVVATSINKTFGSVTATVSESGTGSQYGTVSGSQSINSRDRGTPSGPAGDSDLFRDFVFGGGSGSNIQGTNFLQLTLSGLTPSTSYVVAAYSYDSSGGHTTNWTSVAPTANSGDNGIIGYWDGTNANANFTAPMGEQSITWTSATPAPAIFTLTSSPSGVLSIYGFGGDGITNDQSSDTTYLDGFQIATNVPEPASLTLVGIASLSLLARRRRAQA
jgi:hypothetical protein